MDQHVVDELRGANGHDPIGKEALRDRQRRPCKGSTCTWQLENWGGGWEYSPDIYPTGEEIFATGAGSTSEASTQRTTMP